MSGSGCWFQGFPCRDVRFRRTRGWQADTTTLTLFAADFPDGFEFVTPSPGGLDPLRTLSSPDLSALRRGGLPRPLPHQRRLEFSGALVMAEVDRQGKQYLVVVNPLYCVSLETVRRNLDGSIAVVRARLVDARYFYPRGFLRRWSFNRTDPEGQYARDSVRETGEPFTLAEVAGEVAESLFGTPQLVATPERWRELRPAVDLPPFGPASVALARLAHEHGAGELSLDLDGSVALYRPGEGRVGFCPEGKGASNEGQLPPELLLDLQGTGQTRGLESTYPPDYVVVVGGLRVASVRLYHLDPVLVIEGVPFPLDEELVRRLTGGKHGLTWLAKFVLAPQAYQSDAGLDPRVVDLLREQAWRLWRIPGVEKEVPFREAPGPKPPSQPAPGSFAQAALPSFEQIVAGLRGETRGEPLRVKGRNAHLLPLLDRAETVAGRRLPVRIDAPSFASVHREMAPTREAQAVSSARSRLERLKREIQERMRQAGKSDPWTSPEAFFLFDDQRITGHVLHVLLKDVNRADVSWEQLNNAIDRPRLIERIKKVSPRDADEYARDLETLLTAEQALGGVSKALHDLAKEVLAFEKEVAETRSWFELPDEEATERREELRDRVAGKIRELERRNEERKRRAQLGAPARPTEQTALFVRNLPRRLDPGARVFSAELGIVQTSGLSGHVKEEGVPVAEATSFVPLSPLVTFGAVLRPRVDAPPGRPMTGGSSAKDESQVPEVLSDRESYYTAAYRRLSYGRAEAIELEAIPPGQGVAVERPDLVELVPLEGESNRHLLDPTAEAVASELFRRPERIEARKVSVARPWPVNTDGLVAGVEIATRPNMKGFVTTIYTGTEAPPLDPLGRTRVRVRRGGPSDAARREGTLP